MGIEATNAAYAVRYICVVGLVLLITDYFASFRQERDLIWRAPASFMKYGFLINRYLIPACLVVIYMPLSGFIGLHFSDVACGWIIVVVAAVLAGCIVLDCCMAAVRLANLWDNSKTMVTLMSCILLASYVPHVTTIIIALAQMRPKIIWNPLVSGGEVTGLNMCIATHVSRWLIAASAAPLLFEIFMLLAVSIKYWQLPQKAAQSLKHTIARDGVFFFSAIISLRVLHLGLVATLKAELVLIGVLSISVTSLLSILSNYRLLASRSASMAEHARRATKTVPLTPSVYGLRARRNSSQGGDLPKGNWLAKGGEEIELSHVAVEVQSETKVVHD